MSWRRTAMIGLGLSVVLWASWSAADKSGVGASAINLPGGPGSISGLGGSFEASLNSGVGSYSVAIDIPPGVNGLTPQIALSYSSGGGNGMCGMGWSLPCDFVQRNTEDGLPSYGADEGYIASTGEDLVRIFDDARWPDREFYLQRRENALTRYEMKTAAAPDGQDYWEAVGKDGTQLIFGVSVEARVSDPGDPSHIYRWMLEEVVDPFGNRMTYHWFKDGNQPYLQEIRYAYQDPQSTVYNSVHFIYDNTLSTEQQRPDVLSDYRTTFELVTRYRLIAVEARCNGQRVRKYKIEYGSDSPLSLINRVTEYNSLADDSESFPPLDFTYTTLANGQGTLRTMSSTPSLALGASNIELIDLNADSFPDILFTDTSSRHRYWLNRNGQSWSWTTFSHLMTGDPDGLMLQLNTASVNVADLDGDGRVDLFSKTSGGTHDYDFRVYGLASCTGFSTVPNWENKVQCVEPLPSFALDNADTRLLDINADGRIDAMATAANGYVSYWVNEGLDDQNRIKWTGGTGHTIRETNFVADSVRLSNGAQLADVNGDGLQDMVVMGSGFFYWWPNRGWRGDNAPVFGAKRQMAPRFQVEERLEDYLMLGDINADGMTDVFVLDYAKLYYWINQGGRWSDSNPATGSYADPYQLNIPGFDFTENIRLADMNANGSVDIVFSKMASCRYYDFTGGVRPNLLKTVVNNLGKVTTIDYRSSSDYYIQDDGTPAQWSTSLPFSIQVVSKITLEDGVKHVYNASTAYDNRIVTEFYYHDGYYDVPKKQFRGFRTAEKREIGDDSLPTMVEWYNYDVGDSDENMRGLLKTLTVTDAAGNVFVHKANTYEVSTILDAESAPISTGADDSIIIVLPTKFEQWTVEGAWQRQANGQFQDVADRAPPTYSYATLAYDDWGNMTESIGYGLVVDGDVNAGNDEVYSYSEVANHTDPDNWRLGVGLRVYQRESPEGEYIDLTRFYYDGTDYEGLPLGQFDRALLKKIEVWDGVKWIPSKRFAYDGYGNVTSTKDALGRVTEVDYDPTFHILPVRSRVIGEDQVFETSVEYDPVLWTVTRSTDLNGHATEYRYDNWSRLLKVITPGDSEEFPSVEYAYHLGNPVSWTEARAREEVGLPGTLDSRAYFDGFGGKIEEKSECEDAPDGSQRFVISGLAQFAKRGLARRTFLPDFTATWDFESPDSLALESRNHSDVYYDCLGRTVRIEPFGQDKTPTTVEYRPAEVEAWDAEDNTEDGPHEATPTLKRYDGLGRVTEMVENNEGETYTSRFTYNARGDLVKYTDALANETFIEYDPLGRRTRLDDPDSGISTFTYDDLGRLTSVTDAKSQIKTVYYDDFDRVDRIDYSTTPGEPNDVEYHYDAPSPYLPHARNLKGRLSWVKDATGARFFSYDDRSRPDVTGRDLLGTVYLNRTFYDARNRPTSVVYPDRSQVDYVYGKGGMLEGIPGYLDDVVYAADGRMDSLTYHNGVKHEYGYDDRLRLQTVRGTTANGSGSRIQDLEYSFDRVNNISGVTDHRFDGESVQPANSHTQSVAYDDLYRLTHASGSYGELNHTYDATGNILTRTSTNATVNLGAYVYGTRRDEGAAGPHALLSAGLWNFEYDANGAMTRRKMKSDGAVEADYEYDINGRLTQVETADGTVTESLYDSEGNRVRKRVTSPGGAVHETLYVSAGYEIDDGVASRYVFGAGRRIARVYGATAPPAGSGGCYLFSGVLGERIKNEYGPPRAPGELRREVATVLPFLLVPLLLMVASCYRRLLAGGRAAFRVVQLRPARCAVVLVLIVALLVSTNAAALEAWARPAPKSGPAPGTYYYHPDHLGSSELVTDQAGNVVEETAYHPYGSVSFHSGMEAAKYTFTGQEFDADSALYHLGSRFYDPVLGRFISADSMVPGTNNPQNFNRYAYVNNNPLRYSDPSGHGWLGNFVHGAGGAFKTFAPVVLSIATTAVLQYCGVPAPVAAAIGGFVGGFASGMLNGQSVGTSFKLGLVGAVGGAVTAGVGGGSNTICATAASSFCGAMASSVTATVLFRSEISWKQVMIATAAGVAAGQVGKNYSGTAASIGRGAVSAAAGLLSGGSTKQALASGIGVAIGSEIASSLADSSSSGDAKVRGGDELGESNYDKARIGKALEDLKKTPYAQTERGRDNIARLERLYRENKIDFSTSLEGTSALGRVFTNGQMVLNSRLTPDALMSTLVHEGIHELQLARGDTLYSDVDELEAYYEEVRAGFRDCLPTVDTIVSAYGGKWDIRYIRTFFDSNNFDWKSAYSKGPYCTSN